ncbi:MAG: AAA family ATPase [Turicibacter sp.]
MKPISLKITAFGPFAKPCELNFKDDLNGQDIFVITGPTGSGKTTIFDAICYALYGATSGATRSGKELRSDFVDLDGDRTEIEFTFSVKDKQYKITRAPEQLQKKKRGDGYREIPAAIVFEELDSDALPLTKVNEVASAIHEVVGLTVEQFRKIVMIPQGDFKDFLTANTGEKEELLRKIFGTHLFKQIQEQLDNTAKELKKNALATENEIVAQFKNFKCQEQDALNLMIANNEPISSLIQEAEVSITQEKNKTATLLEEINALKLKYSKQMDHYNQAVKVEEKFVSLGRSELKFSELAKQKDEMKQIKETLLCAKNAEVVSRAQSHYFEKEVAVKKSNEALVQEQLNLTKLITAFDASKLEYEKVDDLTQKIEKQVKVIQTFYSYEGDVIKLNEHREEVKLLTTQLDDLMTSLDFKKISLEEVKGVVNTIESMQHLQAQLKTQNIELGHEMDQIKSMDKQLNQLSDKLKNLQLTSKKLVALEAEMTVLLAKVDSLKYKYDEQATLFMNSAAITLAKELKMDRPCPVCGSTHHPNLAPTDKEVPTKEELKHLQVSYEVEKEKLDTLAKHVASDKQKVKSEEQSIAESLENIATLFTNLDRETITIETVVQQQEVLNTRLSDLTQQLKMQHTQLQEVERKLQGAIQKRATLEALEKEIENIQKDYQAKTVAKASAQTSVDDILMRVPTQCQDLINLRVQIKVEEQQKVQLETQKQHIVTDYQRLSNEVASCTSTVASLTDLLATQKQDQAIAKTNYDLSLSEYFEDEVTFEACKLSPQDMLVLEEKIKHYEQECYACEQLIKTLKSDLLDVTRENLVELSTVIDYSKNQIENLMKQLTMMETTITYNEEVLSQILNRYQRIKKQEEQYRIIGDLADMANGRGNGRMTFETYVLSSYFDEVLTYSNQRLQKMTAQRYYLQRREEVKGGGRKGLELDVYDAHTAKTRAVTTLSGGESFKASLALALGLSDTVQHNAGGIQLDTMFIDEGFGTLDSQSLDQAIDILMDLQDNGRLIGVISHVNELKERIRAKLVVESVNPGSRAYFKK